MATVTAAPPVTILESILAWSTDRPLWQRDALRRIVQKGKLDDSDIVELAALCLPNMVSRPPAALLRYPSSRSISPPIREQPIR